MNAARCKDNTSSCLCNQLFILAAGIPSLFLGGLSLTMRESSGDFIKALLLQLWTSAPKVPRPNAWGAVTLLTAPVVHVALTSSDWYGGAVCTRIGPRLPKG